MQPWVETEPLSGLEVLLEPLLGRMIDQMLRRERVRVDLFGCLQPVASVDEDRRVFVQNHGHAGGPGKAGQPLQTFGGGGDIFALMLIGAGNDETVDPGAFQFGAQPGDPLGDVGGWLWVVIRLEHGRYFVMARDGCRLSRSIARIESIMPDHARNSTFFWP